jgi:hypothetical protein
MIGKEEIDKLVRNAYQLQYGEGAIVPVIGKTSEYVVPPVVGPYGQSMYLGAKFIHDKASTAAASEISKALSGHKLNCARCMLRSAEVLNKLFLHHWTSKTPEDFYAKFEIYSPEPFPQIDNNAQEENQH